MMNDGAVRAKSLTWADGLAIELFAVILALYVYGLAHFVEA